MAGVVRVKEGVQFSVIAPGGFRLLGAINKAAADLQWDLTITSGTDGAHSGPDDPHHHGCAYDIRTHDVPDKQKLLDTIIANLKETDLDRFYAFIEDENSSNEHIHCQVKRGTVYP